MSTGRVVALLIAVAVIAYFAASFGANRKQDNTATESDPPYTRPYTRPYVAPERVTLPEPRWVATIMAPNSSQPYWQELQRQQEQEKRAQDQEQRLTDLEQQVCADRGGSYIVGICLP